jgi:hypothetical protein
MKYDYLHEKETVHLKDATPRPWTEIAAALASLGFTLNDDNYSFDRKDHVYAWQTDSYVWMIVFRNDQEVFEEQWNRIELRYLLATLPKDGIKVFTEKVSELAAKLKLSMIYNGEPVTKQALETKLNACAKELTENLGEPGSEEVAIFIESTYPRR